MEIRETNSSGLFRVSRKKGALPLIPLLTIFFGIMMITAWFSISSKYDSTFEKKLGEKQLGLLSTIDSSESTLLYVDQTAKLSIEQSISETAALGGKENSKCGSYLGYSILASSNSIEVKDCFSNPEEAKQLASKIFSSVLNSNLASHPEKIFDKLALKTEFLDGYVKGESTQKLRFKLSDKSKSTYSLFPNFNIENKYDFEEYSKLRQGIESLISECRSSIDTGFCIESKKEEIFSKQGLKTNDLCEHEDYESFLSFAEYVDRCINSQDTGCICRTRPSESIEFKIGIDGEELQINSTINEKFFSINISSNKELVQEDSKEFDDIDNFEFIVKNEEGQLSIKENDESIPGCKLRKRTQFQMCVHNPLIKVKSFDKGSGRMKFSNLTYKFSIEFEEPLDISKFFEDYTIFLTASCEHLDILPALESSFSGLGFKEVFAIASCNQDFSIPDALVSGKTIWLSLETSSDDAISIVSSELESSMVLADSIFDAFNRAENLEYSVAKPSIDIDLENDEIISVRVSSEDIEKDNNEVYVALLTEGVTNSIMNFES